MFKMNTSSQPNYKSIDDVTIDLDQNKSSKETWSCMGSRLFAVMTVMAIIGICLLIYGFNGAESFRFSAFIRKNFDVNENGNENVNINDGMNVSPDVDYSWSFTGVSDVELLSDGDIVTIRGLYGGLLQNPSSTNLVKTVYEYKSNRNLWKFRISYLTGSKSYIFKNLEDNCFLKDSGGYLKCSSPEDVNSFWIMHTVDFYNDDQSDKHRFYTILENYNTGNCFYIASGQDSYFGTGNYCNYPLQGSMVLFERVEGATSSNAVSSSAMELIDSSLKSDSYTPILTFSGIANLNGLNSGNIVTIRGFRSGLLTAPNGFDKVKSVNVFEDNPILWIVGYHSGRNAYYFKNYNYNCYMRTSNGDVLKCSSTLDDKSYWINGGNHYRNDDSSDYPRVYTSLKNYDSNKCLKIEGTTDSKIELKNNVCGGGSSQSWVRFEIVSDA